MQFAVLNMVFLNVPHVKQLAFFIFKSGLVNLIGDTVSVSQTSLQGAPAVPRFCFLPAPWEYWLRAKTRTAGGRQDLVRETLP